MSTDTDSALLSADDESRAQNPNQPLSRRELRLRAEQEKLNRLRADKNGIGSERMR